MEKIFIDYELISKNQKMLNNNQVKKDVQNKDKKLIEKIQRYSEINGLNFQEVIDQILKEPYPITASFFAKDPSKQSIHEKIVLKVLEDTLLKYGWTIEKLPSNSSGSLYCFEGKVLTFNEKKQMEKEEKLKNLELKSIKSIDFQINIGQKRVYLMHKYTKSVGGAQDNQCNDIRTFLTHSIKNDDSDQIFVALLDGEYYTLKNKNGFSKLDELNQSCLESQKENVFATPTENLLFKLEKLIDPKFSKLVA